MEDLQQAQRLREMMRLLVRKLGFLEREGASCCKITISQCHAIVEVGRAGKMSLVDLAETLKLDKSTVSRLIDNLVNQNLILREADTKDRRFIMLALTLQGEEVYQMIEQRMQQYFLQLIDTIPMDKREQVIESIGYLTKFMHAPNCC